MCEWLKDFPASHPLSLAFVDLLHPFRAHLAVGKVAKENSSCRYSTVWMFCCSVLSVNVSSTVSFLLSLLYFYFSLHSKLPLPSLNSWNFRSEGVTHIFLQLRLERKKKLKKSWSLKGKSLESSRVQKSRKSWSRKNHFWGFPLLYDIEKRRKNIILDTLKRKLRKAPEEHFREVEKNISIKAGSKFDWRTFFRSKKLLKD